MFMTDTFQFFISVPIIKLIFQASPFATEVEESAMVCWRLQKHLQVFPTGSVKCIAWSIGSFFSDIPCGLLCASHNGTLTLLRSVNVDSNHSRSASHSRPLFGVECESIKSEASWNENCSQKELPDSKCTSVDHWESVWTGRIQGAPQMISFSPDGRYFAVLQSPSTQQNAVFGGTGRNCNLSVWFRTPSSVMEFDKSVSSNKSGNPSHDSLGQTEKWEPIILPHPSPVITFSWRALSRFIPVGWIPNMLITSAQDHVSRVWVELIKSPNMLTTCGVNKPGDSSGKTSKQSTIWSHPVSDYPSTITITVNPCLIPTESSTEQDDVPQRITFPLPPPLLYHPILRHLLDHWLTDPFTDVQVSIESVQAKDPARNEQMSVPQWSPPRFVFATAISSDGLVSTSSDSCSNATVPANQFFIRWLNNKVYRFDQRIRSLLMDTVARILDMPLSCDKSNTDEDLPNTLTDQIALIDQKFAVLLGEWQHAPDVVLAIHPEDGSLVVWYIHGLDLSVPNPNGIQTCHVRLAEEHGNQSSVESVFTSTPNLGTQLSHVTASLRSRLHEAFPLPEAQSIMPGGLFFYLTASPLNRHQQQLAGVGHHGGILLRFMHRDVLCMMFCRLMVLRNALHLTRPHTIGEAKQVLQTAQPIGHNSRESLILLGLTEFQFLWAALDTKVHGAHYVAVVTRHANGSLRYWRMDVSESSHFQWIVGVNGSARLSGHRFRTEAIVSHPLLPLVLTTSHYKSTENVFHSRDPQTPENHSELILWSVGPVGPLTSSASGPLTGLNCSHCTHERGRSNSTVQFPSSEPVDANVISLSTHGGCSFQGGLFEVARIDVSHSSSAHTWFSDLAWFPCLLTTSVTPYPVALFVGGVTSGPDEIDQLGCFLAFTDAGNSLFRTVQCQEAGGLKNPTDLASSDTTGFLMHLQVILPQSTRRSPEISTEQPAADTVPETLLFHIFPSELIPRAKSDELLKVGDSPDPLVSDKFSSIYFVVRLTRWRSASVGHSQNMTRSSDQTSTCQLEMWRIRVITEAGFLLDSSRPTQTQLSSFDELLTADKVCDCQLQLPPGVSVERAEVSAAHVSWAALSTYNAPPPYLIVSACSDGCLRFWRCEQRVNNTPKDAYESLAQFRWCEWLMPLARALSSSIELDGDQPPFVLDVDCAYSGRLAVAYQPCLPDTSVRITHSSAADWSQVLVAVYECESSGGCEWILEDTIDLSAEVRRHFLHFKTVPCVQLDWVSTEDGGHLLSVMIGSRITVYAPTCRSVTNVSDHQQCPSTLMTTLGEVYLTWSRVATTQIRVTKNVGPIDDLSPLSTVHQNLWLTRKQHDSRYRHAVWLRDGLLLVGADPEMYVYSQWPSESISVRQGVDPNLIQALTVQPVNKDSKCSKQITETDTGNDSAVAGSASMNVARLARTYSAYLLKPSPSSILLNAVPKVPSVVSNIFVSGQRESIKSETTAGKVISTGAISSQMESTEQSLLDNLGLFESIQVFNPVLPQFHPRQLLEWMNLGHIRRVKAILAHLTRCLTAWNQGLTIQSVQKRRPSSSWGSSRFRKGSFGSEIPASVAGLSPGKTASGLPTGGANRISTDQTSILEAPIIPPLPLYVLLAVDKLLASDLVADGVKSDMNFDLMEDLVDGSPSDDGNVFKIQDDGAETDQSDETFLDATGTLNSGKKRKKRESVSLDQSKMSMWSLKPKSLAVMSQFQPEDARLLTEFLVTHQIPGLSPLDQMYLLGIADLMANTHADMTDRLAGLQPTAMEVSVRRMSVSTDGSERKAVLTNQGLDECGLRFLLTVQLYSYLGRTLPPARRAQLLSSGLTNSSLAWAYHSDTEDQLLTCLPSSQFGDGTELTWVEFKRYGCGWWIRSDELLRRCAEKIARTAFQASKDPMEAIVFYLAMHKAKMVAGLFKTIGNQKLENFFRNEFEPGSPACRQAKLNAFRLLSQHRYQQAAGLFLLAGCLDDAVRVCLDTLKDLQLAVVLVRLYTSTSPGMDNRSPDSPYPRLLRQHVVTHEDPFLRSMAYWTLGDPLAALQTLLEGPLLLSPENLTHTANSSTRSSHSARGSIVSGRTILQSPQHPQLLERKVSLAGQSVLASGLAYHSVYPSVFKFYTFLRSHPLVLRQWRLTAPTSADSLAFRRLASMERRLYFRTAHHYSALGCPTLALEVLTKLPLLISESQFDQRGSVLDQFKTTETSNTSQTMSPLPNRPSEAKMSEDAFAWSAQDPFETSVKMDPEPFKIQWSDEDDRSDEDTQTSRQKIVTGHTDIDAQDLGWISSSKDPKELENADPDSATIDDDIVVDLIANQLKFIACLKILAEELSTLAASAESQGISLRQHVWHWLEHELAVVTALTTPSPAETGSDVTAVNQLSNDLDQTHSVSHHVRPQSTTRLQHPTNRIPSGRDGSVSDHLCSMSGGPLTTPSYLISLAQTSRPNLSDPSCADWNNLCASAAIFVSPSTVSVEMREAELNRIQTRLQWLRTHKAFLTSLVNFCGLYGASGVGLQAVRVELLLLLTELYTNPAWHLHSLLAPPTTAFQKTSEPRSRPNELSVEHSVAVPTTQITPWPSATMGLVDGIPLLRTTLHLPPGVLLLPDPVKHIQCMIHDLMSCLETLPPPYLTTAILPCPHNTSGSRTAAVVSATKAPPQQQLPPPPLNVPYQNKAVDGIGYSYCSQCAEIPIHHRQRRVFLLRNLCAALAVCLHQCLSTGGWLGPGQGDTVVGYIALPASSGMSARSVDRLVASGNPLIPNTEPSRWPGVTQLRKYIHAQFLSTKPRSSSVSVTSTGLLTTPSQTSLGSSTPPTVLRSVNRHYLVGLLAQALSSTYLGLLVYALHTRDACALYRLASARLDSTTWGKVFGGTYRAKPTRPKAPPSSGLPTRPPRPERPAPSVNIVCETQPVDNTAGPSATTTQVSTMHKLGRSSFASSPALSAEPVPTDAPSLKSSTPPPSSTAAPPPSDEWFVPPRCSMLSCLLERPPKKNTLTDDPSCVYDSDDSEPPNDSYDSYSDALTKQQRRLRRLLRFVEHSQSAGNKKEAQRRAKEALRRRLARHAGVLDRSDDEDGSVINNVSSFENLYPELVEEERKQAELEAKKALALSSTLPRRWILRRLHLDPDFGDSQFHATSVDLNDWINSLGLAGPGTASDDDLSENEEFDDQDDTRQTTGAMSDSGNQRQWKVQSQWAKGDSYSWRLLRLGLMQLAKRELDRLVQLLDFGSDDLAVYAPGLVTATRLVDTWMVGYRLELTAPPALTTRDLTRVNFLPGLDDSEMKANGLNSATEFQSDALSAAKSVGRSPSAGATRAMLRLRQLTDPSRTPFQTRDPFSLPTKRLWCYLVRQPLLDDLFMRHIFREPRLIQSPIIPKQSILNGTSHAGAEDDEKRQGSETHGLTLSKSGLGSSATNLTVVGAAADESPKSSIGKTARSQPVSKQSGPPNQKSNALLYDDAIRLVHKEQDPLIAMCVNQANYSCIAIATPKEVIELDVDNLVTLPAWYADEAEYDLELMRRPQSRVYPEGGSDDFIVIDSHLDAATGSQGSQGISSAAQPTTSTNVGSGGSGANVILKRTLQAVYSLASHPALPYCHFPAGSRGARVTAMHFDRSGRRFGCGDADGNFGLWNIQTTASDKPPYFRCNCHAKSLADFCFVGSSTLIATVGNGGGVSGEAGSSSHLIGGMNVTSVPATTITVNPTGAYRFGTDASNSVGFGTASSFGLEQNGANVALWDSLLPPHRCGVIRVTDPELECPCTAVAHCVPSLSFGWPNWSAAETSSSAHMPWMASGRPVMVAPRDRVVVVGTKRGDVCFVDLRKPSVLHSFNAHESSAIRTLCVDQASDCLITGSADGNLKIWRLSEPELIASFSGNIHHQGRGAAAAVAAAALFRGNQSAAIIAATHPGVAQIRLLPGVTGASLLHQGKYTVPVVNDYTPSGLSYEQHEREKHSLLSSCTACRFLSCGADGGLRLRSFVVRPKPFTVA
ncbi:hypothetical protein D915_004581 [Fasciola hepatica]|uniref:RAVE complex protein Rav1 C-terminal domain-containing protein n=1 Tax=Fasciola hepatica TaxID=6192 RepID=A0A4E0RDI3_FASHE|nr:hypothetical protein D915_004581 [Fasciola hepatica]